MNYLSRKLVTIVTESALEPMLKLLRLLTLKPIQRPMRKPVIT